MAEEDDLLPRLPAQRIARLEQALRAGLGAACRPAALAVPFRPGLRDRPASGMMRPDTQEPAAGAP